jgi:two-component system response regulator HydG
MREDLYYRLAVVEIALPPLRERADDLQLLASEFLERYSNQNGKKITGFTDDAWQWMLTYHWPGNVRELKNSVERGVIMARGDKITLSDLMPRHLRHTADVPTSVTIAVGASIADAQRQLVLRTFASANGDAARAGKLLGMDADAVRRELLALINSGAGGAGGGAGNSAEDENGRAQRPPTTPATGSVVSEAPGARAKPARRK